MDYLGSKVILVSHSMDSRQPLCLVCIHTFITMKATHMFSDGC